MVLRIGEKNIKYLYISLFIFVCKLTLRWKLTHFVETLVCGGGRLEKKLMNKVETTWTASDGAGGSCRQARVSPPYHNTFSKINLLQQHEPQGFIGIKSG